MAFLIENISMESTINQMVYLLTKYLDSFTVGDYKFSNSLIDQGDWLICDGRSLSRSVYSDLFAAISTNYGSVDGDHFNIPDFSGRIFGQIGNGHEVGDDVGADTVTLSINEIPSHVHTGTTNSSGTHNHSASTDNQGTHNHSASTDNQGLHSHTSNATGGQGNYGLAIADGTNTVVDTDGSSGELNVWTVPGALNINNNGLHNHSVTVVDNGLHNHSVTVVDNGLHTHTFTTNSAGTGGAHQNMQPTLFGGNLFILSNKLSNLVQ
jgi:microcystin-dependent protein